VQEWATVLAPTGIIPILEHGELLDHEKASNATTPSSFDSKKEFKIVKEISLRFLPAFANEENRAFNFQVQEAERALKDVEVHNFPCLPLRCFMFYDLRIFHDCIFSRL
jgi:hypothetical protein